MFFTVICPYCNSHVKVPENSRTNEFRHGVFYSTTGSQYTTSGAITGNEVRATISADNTNYAFFDNNNNILNDEHNNNLLANYSRDDLNLIKLEGCGKTFCIKIDDNGNKYAGVPETSENVKKVRVEKIIPDGYCEGKSIIFEYNDVEVPIIIPENGVPGDLLILDITLGENDLSLMDVQVSRQSSRANLRPSNTGWGNNQGGFASY